MEFRYDRLQSMIQRRMFSAVMLTRILLHFCSTDRTRLRELMDLVAREDLERVFDVLTIYPWTERGWAMLPANRMQFITDDMSMAEEADVDRRQFQDDRRDVEHLRELIRSMGR